MHRPYILSIILLLASLGLADSPSSKLPKPNAAALKEPLQLINEAYKTDLLAAKTSEQKIALSAKLLDAAKEEKDLAARFALLSKARDLAVDAGNFDSALAAIDQLDAAYQIDVLAMRADTAIAVNKLIHTAAQRHVLVFGLGPIIDAACSADRYDLATPLAAIAMSSARSSNDTEMIHSAALRVQEIRDSQAAHAAIKTALATLAASPADLDANLQVGKYFCFIKGDWDRGLPMLALGSNIELKMLATREAASISDPSDQTKLADAWWDVAQRETGIGKTQIEQHAGTWYQRSLSNLSGLAKAKVEARLAILEQHPVIKAAIAPPFMSDLQAGESKTIPLPVDGVYRVTLAPSGTEIYVVAADRNVHLISLVTGKELKKLTVGAEQISRLELSANGRILAIGAYDHTVHIWDTQAPLEMWKFQQGREVCGLAISPDGRRVITGNYGGNGWLYDLQHGTAIPGLTGESAYSAAWSPNGLFAVYGGYNGVMTVWDMKAFKKIREFKLNGQLYVSAISPDSTLIAGSGPGKIIYVWDLASGKEVCQLVGNQDIVHGLAFTPDGRRLLSTSDDNSFRIWDQHSGKEIKHFVMQEGKGECGLAVDPHGRFAVVCTGGAALSLIRLP